MAHQAIQDGRLPHPRGTEQHKRLPWRKVGFQFAESLPGFRADKANGHAHRNVLRLLLLFTQIFAGVRLVQDNYGLRAGLPTLRQVPLDAPWIEIAIERRHQHRRVYVGCDHLFHKLLARHLT